MMKTVKGKLKHALFSENEERIISLIMVTVRQHSNLFLILFFATNNKSSFSKLFFLSKL